MREHLVAAGSLTRYQPDPGKDLDYYAAQVDLCWNRAVVSIVAVGYLLAEARMNLTALQWRRLIEEHCPFDLTIACRLAKIAQDQRITDPDVTKHLPASWHKLYELIQLDEPTFRAGIESGVIHPLMSGADIMALRRPRLPAAPVARATVEPQNSLRDRLLRVLADFPAVLALTAEISDGKSEARQTLVVTRADLQHGP